MAYASSLQPATPIERHRFHFLDALRGLAAILVIMRHTPYAYAAPFVSSNSFLAVDFFFGLSGFVIAFSYEERLASYLTFPAFFVTRIIRLYPIATVGTLLGAFELAIKLHLHAPWPSFLPMISFYTMLGLLVIPAYSSDLFPLDGVMWTLFFELVANFLYAAMMRFRLAATSILIVISILAVGALSLEGMGHRNLDLGSTVDSAYIGFTRVITSFFLGVLTFRIYRRFARIRLKSGVSLVAAAVITAVFVFALCGPPALTTNPALEIPLIVLVFPAVIFVGGHVSLSSRWTSTCVFLGTISYPLYVLHPPMLWPLTSPPAIRFAHMHPLGAHLFVLLYAAALVVLSWLLAMFYDNPIRITLSRLHKNWRADSRAPLQSS